MLARRVPALPSLGGGMHTEAYLRDGPGSGDALALLGVAVGGPAGRPIAQALLSRWGSVGQLASLEPRELTTVQGLGIQGARRLHAALNLGLKCAREAAPAVHPVRDAADAYAQLKHRFVGLQHEELHALYLDRRHGVVAIRTLTRGSACFTVVDVRQVFRPAVALGAAAVVLAHNHPSGDARPSRQDRLVTRRVAHAGRTLGIPLMDHLVVGDQRYTSLVAECEPVSTPLAAQWTASPTPAR